jgi:hypothetical protein
MPQHASTCLNMPQRSVDIPVVLQGCAGCAHRGAVPCQLAPDWSQLCVVRPAGPVPQSPGTCRSPRHAARAARAARAAAPNPPPAGPLSVAPSFSLQNLVHPCPCKVPSAREGQHARDHDQIHRNVFRASRCSISLSAYLSFSSRSHAITAEKLPSRRQRYP